jgi:hypothetical protein
MEGSALSEAEKEDAHGVRAGYVRAPATPGVMAHRRKERKRRLLDDGDASGFTGTLAVTRSGRGGLREGAVVAVKEQPPQREREREREKNSLQEDVESTASGKEGKVIHR